MENRHNSPDLFYNEDNYFKKTVFLNYLTKPNSIFVSIYIILSFNSIVMFDSSLDNWRFLCGNLN